MNVVFLFMIVVSLSGSDLTSEKEMLLLTAGDITSENETLHSTGGDLTSENETLALNVSAINNIITSKISVNGNEMNESKAINYLYGESNFNDSAQHLDLSDFEPDKVKRLYYTAQAKSKLIEREYINTRKSKKIFSDYYNVKALDFMRQSIYGTRYRLKDTKHIRNYFSKDPGYQIAILYGSLMQLRIKMDNMFATLNAFDKHISFIWYIVVYERCIATTVDANSMVERVFAIAQKAMKDFGIETEYNPVGQANYDQFLPNYHN